MYRKFIDKDAAGNLIDGLEFYAVGLVAVDYINPDGTGRPSGKDYAVEFIDPWGDYRHEWRAVDEIIVSEIDEADFKYLKICYENIQRLICWTPNEYAETFRLPSRGG